MELFIVVANSCVHVVMYSYYFLCSLKLCPKWVQKLKPLLTSLQIVQLSLMLEHCLVALGPDCGATRIFYLQTLNIVVLLCLFVNFYQNSYGKKQKLLPANGDKSN